jgi:phosphate transport system protein
MAQDLRETVAAIRIVSDLERIGDLGKNIARRALAIREHTFSNSVRVGVEHLAELGVKQVKTVLDAYATRDLDKAREVCARDEEIDNVYTSLFRQLLTYMMEDPRNISMCTHLLFCAKNIERIGDHATNIAETVFYMIEGQQIMDKRPKGDMTTFATTVPGNN